jgi:UDP-2,3-diacylglucosamine pyrophosphatase LpxH
MQESGTGIGVVAAWISNYYLIQNTVAFTMFSCAVHKYLVLFLFLQTEARSRVLIFYKKKKKKKKKKTNNNNNNLPSRGLTKIEKPLL